VKIEEMITAIQGELGVTVDGKAGPETWRAIYERVVGPRIGSAAPAPSVSAADARSEKVIATLLSEVRPLARALVEKAASNGIRVRVISGHRSYEEQDELYAQGRTKPGAIVTRAKGGYSNHNFGLAFDVGVFEGNRYLPESPKYKAVGALGMELGLEWGGSWRSLVDEPHFQLRPAWAQGLTERQMLAQCRDRVAGGQHLFA
jgi:peptidoglycan L-alanyl-D-glutamate endopeptidase CwlK